MSYVFHTSDEIRTQTHHDYRVYQMSVKKRLLTRRVTSTCADTLNTKIRLNCLQNFRSYLTKKTVRLLKTIDVYSRNHMKYMNKSDGKVCNLHIFATLPCV